MDTPHATSALLRCGLAQDAKANAGLNPRQVLEQSAVSDGIHVLFSSPPPQQGRELQVCPTSGSVTPQQALCLLPCPDPGLSAHISSEPSEGAAS